MNAAAHSTHASPEPPSGAAVSSRKKPRLSLLLATAFGLGLIPVAPGTFGSIAGLILALLPFQFLRAMGVDGIQSFAIGSTSIDPLRLIQLGIAVAVALVGVFVASRAARHWQQKDPQRVVIDEVSGQHLTLVLGALLPFWWRPEVFSWAPHGLGFITYESPLNWKYLLAGLILFRVFDIWKPFPVRQAESLRGGWGIMADDWIAGIFAGLCLWAVRGFLL